MSRETVLNGLVHEFDESVFVLALPQLVFKLGRKQVEELGIASDEGGGRIGSAEDDLVARAPLITLQPRFFSIARRLTRCCTFSTRMGLNWVSAP